MMRTTVHVLAALFWAAAMLANAAAAEPSREQALRDLASPIAETRRAAATRLGESGRMSDVAILVKALHDRDEATRETSEAAIWQIWGRSGDAGVDELYQKGVALMNFGAAREAIQLFTLVIAQKPDFAES